MALHFACEMGYVQIVKYLLQHGADLEVMDEVSLLFTAIDFNSN